MNAGRTFDYHLEHPELARLLQWESLRGTPPVNASARTAHYRHKVDAARQAQQDTLIDNSIDPGHLMFMIIGVAALWSCLPQLATLVTGADPDADGEHARRRAYVVDAARRLAAGNNGPIRSHTSPESTPRDIAPGSPERRERH